MIRRLTWRERLHTWWAEKKQACRDYRAYLRDHLR